MHPIRIGRGCAPVEIDLPWRQAAPTLAVGGHMKNTIALAWGDRLVLSPHIGDMGTARSVAVFEQVLSDLQALYGVRVAAVDMEQRRIDFEPVEPKPRSRRRRRRAKPADASTPGRRRTQEDGRSRLSR